MKLILTACVVLAFASSFEMPENFGEYFRQMEANFYDNFQPEPAAPLADSQPRNLQKFSVFSHSAPAAPPKNDFQPLSDSDPFELTAKKPKVVAWAERAERIHSNIERNIPQNILDVREYESKPVHRKRKARKLHRRGRRAQSAMFAGEPDPWKAQHYYTEDGFIEPTQLEDNSLDEMEEFYEDQAYQTQRQAANEYTFDLRNMILQEKMNQRLNSLAAQPVSLAENEALDDEENDPDASLATLDPENDGFKISKADFCAFLWNRYQFNCDAHQQMLDGYFGPEDNGIGMPGQPGANFEGLFRDIQNYQMMRGNPLEPQNAWVSGSAMQTAQPVGEYPQPEEMEPAEVSEAAEEEEQEGNEDYEAEDDPDYDYYESYFPANHLKRLASDNYLDELNKVISEMAPRPATEPTTSDFDELHPAKLPVPTAADTPRSPSADLVSSSGHVKAPSHRVKKHHTVFHRSSPTASVSPPTKEPKETSDASKGAAKGYFRKFNPQVPVAAPKEPIYSLEAGKQTEDSLIRSPEPLDSEPGAHGLAISEHPAHIVTSKRASKAIFQKIAQKDISGTSNASKDIKDSKDAPETPKEDSETPKDSLDTSKDSSEAPTDSLDTPELGETTSAMSSNPPLIVKNTKESKVLFNKISHKDFPKVFGLKGKTIDESKTENSPETLQSDNQTVSEPKEQVAAVLTEPEPVVAEPTAKEEVVTVTEPEKTELKEAVTPPVEEKVMTGETETAPAPVVKEEQKGELPLQTPDEVFVADAEEPPKIIEVPPPSDEDVLDEPDEPEVPGQKVERPVLAPVGKLSTEDEPKKSEVKPEETPGPNPSTDNQNIEEPSNPVTGISTEKPATSPEQSDANPSVATPEKPVESEPQPQPPTEQPDAKQDPSQSTPTDIENPEKSILEVDEVKQVDEIQKLLSEAPEGERPEEQADKPPTKRHLKAGI